MKRILLLSAGLALTANMTMAAISPAALAAAYQAKGYSDVHVTQGPSQIKVEAVRDHARVEVVYDATSGAILKQEDSFAGSAGSGVTRIAATDKDFLDDSGTDPEDLNDDAGDDNGTGTETEHESEHGSEHEGGDHGGSGHDGGNGGGED